MINKFVFSFLILSTFWLYQNELYCTCEKKNSIDFKSGVVLTSGKQNNVLSTNSLLKDFILKESELLFSFRLKDGSWETKKISIE